jgi:hypothetical protein
VEDKKQDKQEVSVKEEAECRISRMAVSRCGGSKQVDQQIDQQFQNQRWGAGSWCENKRNVKK